jgi:hypothetical protein
MTPPTSSSPLKRPKLSSNTPSPPESKTPDAPTIPADPNHSGESIESDKVEETCKDLIRAFMEEIRFFLGHHFNTLHWVQSLSKPKIAISPYNPSPQVLIIQGAQYETHTQQGEDMFQK